MTALCSLVLGRQPVARVSSDFVSALHCLLSLLHVSAWWEWVLSPSNPEDGGTRRGYKWFVAHSMGIDLQEVEFPKMTFSLLDLEPSETLVLLSARILPVV